MNKFINVLHQNIAGAINKADLLLANLDNLSDNGKCIDVICLTEHFMKAGNEVHLTVHNYNLASYFCRENGNRGGACILIKHGHLWKDVPEIAKLSITNIFECCAVELTNYKLLIVCIYRIPKATNVNTFFLRLEQLLSFVSKKNYNNIILAGDYNINTLVNNNLTLEFQCLLSNYNLKLAINQPTRLRSKTCIDNIAHDFKKGSRAEVIEFALSDHTAQIVQVPARIVPTLKFWKKRQRDYSDQNINKFRECLKSFSFSELYDMLDCNNAFNYFMEHFKLFYDLCFPFKIVKIPIISKPKWLSRGIKRCTYKKRQLLWVWRHKPNLTNKINYKNYSKRLKKIITLTKLSQNNHRIKTSQNKAKTTWQIINKPQFNLPSNHINDIQTDTFILTDPKKIANHFNDFFIEKDFAITERCKNDQSKIPALNNSMFMAPSLPLEILKIIKNLRNTNSVGYDEISVKILKAVSEEICCHLCHIINLSIETGTYPESLKVSIVKPLFKKGDKRLVNNFRPIALPPVISKVFEKYFYGQINNFLEKHNILCNEQKGFRQNKTINMAVFDFLKNVMFNVDIRKPVCAIYCDMTQAFDYVDHNILINKLNKYGIRGNIQSLILSYLSNRKQYTSIARINLTTKREEIFNSRERVVKYGVPQGSVLGPLLFIIYINDMPKSINHPVTLFADDCTVTIGANDISCYEKEIHESLTSIKLWLKSNNLKINLSKTQIMQFSQRSSNIQLNSIKNTICMTNTAKFLGLMIDSNLNWKAHIEVISKKLGSTAYALFKLSAVLNIDALLTAYHGLAASTLRFGIIFWGNSTNRDIAFKMQKRCIRSMFRLEVTDSCKPYFVKYNILSLPSLYIFEVIMFVKCNPHLFPRLSDTVVRNRRDKHKLRAQASKTALLQNSVYCMGSKLFNKIPKSLKECNNINIFKSKLNAFLINKCYYNVKEFLNDKIL